MTEYQGFSAFQADNEFEIVDLTELWPDNQDRLEFCDVDAVNSYLHTE